MAKMRRAFELLSNVAVAAARGGESVTGVDDRLVEYVMLTLKVSVNAVGSVQAEVLKQWLTTLAGTTNFGSAFESTETVDEGIAVPLEPKDCSAVVG
jgi:hypothetical protein